MSRVFDQNLSLKTPLNVLRAASPSVTPVAIIGAGPYGLSLAAHLRAKGVEFRIFGRPMQMWLSHMPRDMHLKSEPFACDLYEASGEFTLRRYCEENGLPYRRIGLPVSRKVFCDYALAFQRRFVPDIDRQDVVNLRRIGEGRSAFFALELEDGSLVHAGNVVVAVGISHYPHLPDNLRSIAPERLSHSSAVADPDRFAGQKIAVIGGGSSAIDCAVMLASCGSEAHVLTRRATLRFHSAPRRRTIRDRIRHPMSTVGPGWRGVLCTRLPDLFHAMPRSFRLEKTRRFLGPAPCWFTRTPFEQSVHLHLAVQGLTGEPEANGRLRLRYMSQGEPETLEVDHVVAATGYRADLDRLMFMQRGLRESIAREEGTPILSRRFETSVPGLFFIGVSASNSFGPMLRFACGAGFAARRLSRHFSRRAIRQSTRDPVAADRSKQSSLPTQRSSQHVRTLPAAAMPPGQT